MIAMHIPDGFIDAPTSLAAAARGDRWCDVVSAHDVANARGP